MATSRSGPPAGLTADPPADPKIAGSHPGTRILSRREVERLLSLEDCIDAVEAAFAAHAAGSSIPPGVLSVHVEGGGFHIKAAGLAGGSSYFAAKMNGNFYANSERFGLARIQGLIFLADATNGLPLAVMDSTLITIVRTGAATAVAARYLARTDAATATICGCGLQGRIQLAALRAVRDLRTAYLVDSDPAAAEKLASELRGEIEVRVLPAEQMAEGTRQSDICVTSTPSHSPLIGLADVAPGTFIAAVGADSEEKQELDPKLLQASLVVVDHLEQCASIGELHHAIDAGVLARADVHAELFEVIAGIRPGRTRADQTFIFDSTGVALEDVAAAAMAYERAVAADAGVLIDLGAAEGA